MPDSMQSPNASTPAAITLVGNQASHAVWLRLLPHHACPSVHPEAWLLEGNLRWA